ncbi:DUF481 domain-containing protein [Congregibacter brevis]|uniref:DUF481 domain-containing protein n=1 Tax=Congregibacter brevis TaxID=3081201 RepID=A0ABZ0I8K0_9GAMM|nr:DUF481 domain-containing protein [Congregibacter sp. IMCC45268]
MNSPETLPRHIAYPSAGRLSHLEHAQLENTLLEKNWRLLRVTMVIMLLLVSVCLSESAAAQRKTDTITLYNGDRVTGEIKSLLGGRLSFKTDAMGTLDIEWKEIASIESNYNYELRLDNGQRFYGSVKPGSISGTVTLEDVFGKKSFGWQEIVEIRPVEDTLIDRIDIYIAANYAFTKASGVTQTEFRADFSYEDEKTLNSLTSRITVSDTDDDSTSSSRVSLSRKAWVDRSVNYRLVFGGYETNDELGLDYRLSLGAGVGRYFIETPRSELIGSMSLQALEERSIGGDSLESLEGVLTFGYSRWRYDTPELKLKLDASVYPSVTEKGRVRADTAATVRWEMVEDLFWDFSAWGSFDNSTVEINAAGEFDWGVTTGVGWSF